MYRDRNQRDFARNLRREMTEAECELWRALRCDAKSFSTTSFAGRPPSARPSLIRVFRLETDR